MQMGFLIILAHMGEKCHNIGMVNLLLVSGIVLLSALISRVTHKLGIPVLLAFVVLGMLVGENGIFHIQFSDYKLSEFICTVALVFIMFYGGFGTNWNQARPVVFKASVLASLGIVLTTLFMGLVCIFVLKMPKYEAFLLGAILSSTDAASVFSLLRSKNLGLKENTASLLEVESGSNDPFAYMLTLIILSMMDNQVSGAELFILTVKQLGLGAFCGVMIAWITVKFLRYYKFPIPGFNMAFIIGIALFSYALPTSIDGNGYLSVYITGIALGNCRLYEKKSLVIFFDGFTSLMQMLIFFLLGFLATPALIPEVFVSAVIIGALLTFFVRPLAIALCLTPFRCSLPQQLLVSFAGLRGASSVVFAIMATVHEAETPGYLFHTVFCIVLLSIIFQGTLLAPVARKLNMCDGNIDDTKNFNDYTESQISVISLDIYHGHPWINKALHEIQLPPDMLVTMLLREGKNVLSGGDTVFLCNDTAVLCAPKNLENVSLVLYEEHIDENSAWVGQSIASFADADKQSKKLFVVMLLRGKKTVIPHGKTLILANDILVIADN